MNASLMLGAIIGLGAAAALDGPAGYDLTWSAVAGGGGTSAAGTLVLSATIGQWSAGAMSGDAFTLVGGFWSGGTVGAPPCAAADLDCDGTVGFGDLLRLLSAWGACADCAACPADLDGGCTVGFEDLLLLLSAWTG